MRSHGVKNHEVANVVETRMQWGLNEFEIDKAYDIDLRNKMDAFRRETGTVKTLQLVMITTFGVRKNKYSNIVSGQVVLEDLFRPVFRY